MSGALAIARHGLGEALRRRVFAVVLVLTAAFLALYWLGARRVFQEVEELAVGDVVDERTVAGATLFGLAMFGTLFLGVVLAVFLTLGAVRGDAERGLLQPVVVRPPGRLSFLAGRLAIAVVVPAAYVLAVYSAAAGLTWEAGGFWPGSFLLPGLELAAAAAVVAVLALLGTVLLSPTANGIAVFMVYGAGLVAGLLGQIGEALGSETLDSISRTATRILPFETLYQDALHRLTADLTGVEAFVVRLGPFGGAQPAAAGELLWAGAYAALAAAVAFAVFGRRDL